MTACIRVRSIFQAAVLRRTTVHGYESGFRDVPSETSYLSQTSSSVVIPLQVRHPRAAVTNRSPPSRRLLLTLLRQHGRPLAVTQVHVSGQMPTQRPRGSTATAFAESHVASGPSSHLSADLRAAPTARARALVF